MSEAIAAVLKFAFGFISNKLRTYGAEILLTKNLEVGLYVNWTILSSNLMLFRGKISL